MKKKLLRIFFAFIMFFSVLPTQHIYNKEETKINAVNHTGGEIYFNNSLTGWTDKYIMLLIGHNNYTSVYEMTKVDDANLYHYTMPSWGGATYCCIIGASDLWGSGDFGPSNRTNASHYTNVYNNYTFYSGSYYIIEPSESSNATGISIDYRDSRDNFNKYYTLSAYASYKTGNSSYVEGVTGGNVEIKGYYLNNATTSGNSTSSTNSTTNPATFGVCPGTNPTFTATPNIGYNFDGWYSALTEGSLLSSSATYTLSNAKDTTVYARFSEKSYTITYSPGANGKGTVSPSTKYHTSNLTLSSSTFTRIGYTQTGWSETDGGAKSYDLGGTYTDTAAITLYPYWTP